MSDRILVIKNTRWVRPGLLGNILDMYDLGTETVELDDGDYIPDVRPYPAVIVLGGIASANDNTDTMHQQLDRLAQAFEHNVPVMGICLGMQVLAKAAGGSVNRAPEMEAGFFDSHGEPYTVELTDAGRRDQLLYGLPHHFRAFHSHGDEVQLAEGIELLAKGTSGTVSQIVRVGRCAYGLQMHNEIVPELLADWTRIDDHFADMDSVALQNELKLIGGEMARNFRSITDNFLALAGLTTASIPEHASEVAVG